MESALVQANSDVAEVIKEYNRNTVASLGVIDGKLFINQVDEAGKDYWLKEAGGFKKYCEDIPTVKSDQDLSCLLYTSEFKGWADEYESAALERRRVILSQLFSRIEIGRGYEVKVEIAMSYKQFLNLSENTQTGNRTIA